MVDFNNESTITTPPGEIVKIVVLERREQAIEAMENFDLATANHQDTTVKVDILYARVRALWREVQAMAKRRLKRAKGTDDSPSYDMVQDSILSAKEEGELVQAFEWMNEFIDDMGLTQIDGRAKYDRTIIEDANIKKGV